MRSLKSAVLSRCLAAILVTPAASCAHTPVAPSQPPAGESAPAACLDHMSGAKFMRMIQKIISHGDLTDVAYTEKLLHAKFTLSYSDGPDGKPDPQRLFYFIGPEQRAPLGASLYVNLSKQDQLKDAEFAFMRIGGAYISDCVHVPAASFASYFGGDFFSAIATDGGGITGAFQGHSTPGKNGTKLFLRIDYEHNGSNVSEVMIDQTR